MTVGDARTWLSGRGQPVAIMVVLGLLAGSIAVVHLDEPAAAGPSNPGSFEANGLVVSGMFGSLPFTFGDVVAECSDGVNNDAAFNDPHEAQDLLVDYPADPECTDPSDASEIAPGHQLLEANSLSGSLDAVGDVLVPQNGAAFTRDFFFYGISLPGIALDAPTSAGSRHSLGIRGAVTLEVVGDVTGMLFNDAAYTPESGYEASLDLPIRINVAFPTLGVSCDTGPVVVPLSDSAGSAVNQGSLPVSPSQYSSADGSVALANNVFALPASVSSPSTPDAVCKVIDTVFGLPSPAGANVIEMVGTFSDGRGLPFQTTTSTTTTTVPPTTTTTSTTTTTVPPTTTTTSTTTTSTTTTSTTTTTTTVLPTTTTTSTTTTSTTTTTVRPTPRAGPPPPAPAPPAPAPAAPAPALSSPAPAPTPTTTAPEAVVLGASITAPSSPADEPAAPGLGSDPVVSLGAAGS